MRKGDIVLTKFPFTDFSGNKLRPALVLISSREDITVAFITTNLKEVGSSDLLLKANQNNGAECRGLKIQRYGKISYVVFVESRDCLRLPVLVFASWVEVRNPT